MGIAEDRETGETYIFQIESSGQWLAEYGSAQGGNLYLVNGSFTKLADAGAFAKKNEKEETTHEE